METGRVVREVRRFEVEKTIGVQRGGGGAGRVCVCGGGRSC